jgi:hypothetical protein
MSQRHIVASGPNPMQLSMLRVSVYRSVTLRVFRSTLISFGDPAGAVVSTK